MTSHFNTGPCEGHKHYLVLPPEHRPGLLEAPERGAGAEAETRLRAELLADVADVKDLQPPARSQPLSTKQLIKHAQPVRVWRC